MSTFILHDHIVDPEAGRLSSYFCQLFILIGRDNVQYALLDTDSSSFIAVADYRMNEFPGNRAAFYGEFEKLAEADEFLRKKYPSVVMATDTPFHTLVPSALFEDNKRLDYLQFNFKLPEGFSGSDDKIPEIDSFNVFGIESIDETFRYKFFPGAVMVHRTTAFLKSVYRHYKQQNQRAAAYLNIRNPYIDMAIFEGEKLVFFNSFSCRSKEDILYFSLYTLEQMNLRPENVNLILNGFVDEGSEVFHLLEQFIRPVAFMSLSDPYKYSPLIRQAEHHRYTELFGLALCGL